MNNIFSRLITMLGCHGRDHLVVGFITPYAISA